MLIRSVARAVSGSVRWPWSAELRLEGLEEKGGRGEATAAKPTLTAKPNLTWHPLSFTPRL